MDNEKAIEIIKAYKDQLTNSCSNQLDNDIEAFTLAINAMEERPQGEWLEPYESKIAQECSICHRQMPAPKWFHFCPNCGADMRKGGAE